jgi:hypothetical protein
MASSQAASNQFLTTVTLVLVFLLQIASTFGDLAPNEDEIESPQKDLVANKNDDTVTTSVTTTSRSNLGFIHAFIASFSVIIVSGSLSFLSYQSGNIFTGQNRNSNPQTRF